MGLFKKKLSDDDDDVRCPNCGERVPAGSRQCTMCGRSLADVADEAARERAGDANAR